MKNVLSLIDLMMFMISIAIKTQDWKIEWK